MIDKDGAIDVDRLQEIAGVKFTDDHVAELMAISIANAGEIGAPDPVNSMLLKKLRTVEASAKRLLQVVDDGSPEAFLIRSRFIDEEARKQIRDLVEWARFLETECASSVSGQGSGRKKQYAGIGNFVARCRCVWIDAGGRGLGSYKSNWSGTGYDGPLLALVRALLVGWNSVEPSDATIHRAIEEVAKAGSGHNEKK